MRAMPFPQANKILKAPPSPRTEIQELIDKLAAGGVDMTAEQERLDAAFPPDQEVYDLPVWSGLAGGTYRCISCWEPSEEERAAIAAGGPVWLWVAGHTHPPLVLDVASPFESAAPAVARPTVADSFRELLERVTLRPEEERVVQSARIDRLTGQKHAPYRPGGKVDEP